MDSEDDFSKFNPNRDDRIRPIDMDDRPPAEKRPSPDEHGVDAGASPQQGGGNPPPVSEGGNNPAPPLSDSGLPNAELPGGGASSPPGAKSSEPFLKDDDWEDDDGPIRAKRPQIDPRSDVAAPDVVFIKRGEFCDITEKDPTLKAIKIGAGWDQRSLEGEAVDVDLSLFLLDKTDMTRIDEDFIFYNNDRACDGAIHHIMDSRTGAGDGDDENVFIDLNGIPFDILKIVFTFSVYDPEIKGDHFGMVKNMFFNIVNHDDGREIVRYRLDPDHHKGGNGMIVAVLLREGPRWILEAKADVSNGGLGKIATEYGIIVKELQGTGEDVVGEDMSLQPAAKPKIAPDIPDDGPGPIDTSTPSPRSPSSSSPVAEPDFGPEPDFGGAPDRRAGHEIGRGSDEDNF